MSSSATATAAESPSLNLSPPFASTTDLPHSTDRHRIKHRGPTTHRRGPRPPPDEVSSQFWTNRTGRFIQGQNNSTANAAAAATELLRHALGVRMNQYGDDDDYVAVMLLGTRFRWYKRERIFSPCLSTNIYSSLCRLILLLMYYITISMCK